MQVIDSCDWQWDQQGKKTTATVLLNPEDYIPKGVSWWFSSLKATLTSVTENC